MMELSKMILLLVTFLTISIRSSHGQAADVVITEAIPLTTGIQVSWTYLGSAVSELDRYTVRFRYMGPCQGVNVLDLIVTVRLLTTTSLHWDRDLLPFSDYLIIVTAHPLAGSTSEDSTTASTFPATPGAPINIRATDLTTSSATIVWDPVPCLQRNDEIVEYIVDIGISGNVALRVRLVENGTLLTETGLEAGMSYFFEVFAVGNNTGQGIGATPLHLQTLLDPFITSITTQPNSATLTWELPQFDESIQVDVQGHNISYTYVGPCVGEVEQRGEISLARENRTVEIGGLMAFSYYSVTVVTIYPNDTVSTTTWISTLPSVPAAPPDSVTVVNISDSQITIGWEEVRCQYRNSNITSYELLWGPTSTYTQQGNRSEVQTTGNSYSFSDLESDTSYSFQIAPVTSHQLPSGAVVPMTGRVLVITQITLEAPTPGLLENLEENTFFIIIGSLGGGVLVLLLALICTLAVCCRQCKQSLKASPNTLSLTNFDNMEMEGCQAYISTDIPSLRTNLPSPRTNLPSPRTNLPSPRTSLPLGPPPSPPIVVLPQEELVTSTSNQYDSIHYNKYTGVWKQATLTAH